MVSRVLCRRGHGNTILLLLDAQAAQRKMLDVLNTVGLSDTLLRVIDRRHKMDRWLTYGGMVSLPEFVDSTSRVISAL